MQKWEDAEESFLKYITLYPRSELVERAYLAAANSQIELLKYKEAEENLRIIISRYHKSDRYEEASVLYSFVLMKNKKNNEAKEFLNSWIEKLGKTGEKFVYKDRFWLYTAEILMEEKAVIEAKALLKKIDVNCKNSPSSDIALLRLSQIEEMLGNEKESKEYILRLGNEYPSSKYNIDATISMGIASYNKERYTDAMVFFRGANDSIEKSIKSRNISTEEEQRIKELRITALYYLGETFFKLKDLDSAKDFFLRIVELENKMISESLLKLVEILSLQKKTKEAYQYIIKNENKILSDKKNYDKLLTYKSKIQFQLGNYTESLQSLELIKNKNDYLVLVATLKSNNLIKLNRNIEALDYMLNIFSQIPINSKPNFAFDIMNLYFNLGEYQNTLKYYEILNAYLNSITSDNLTDIAIKSDYLCGLSYLQIKDNKKGINVFKNLIDKSRRMNLNTELSEIINKSFYYLGWFYYRESIFTDSAKNFGAASLLDIGEELKRDSYYMEAWSYFSNKDYQTASVKFESVYKKYNNEEIGLKSYFQMAKCYENLKRVDKAIEVYTKIYTETKDSIYKENAIFELIKYNLTNKEFNTANKLLSDLSKINSEGDFYYKAILLQADSFMSSERYSEAYSNYNFYLRKNENKENLDVIYYWSGYCAYQIKDDISAIEMLSYLTVNYRNSNFYYETLSLLQSIYNRQKDIIKEKETINKLMLVEKDQNKIKTLINMLDEINLIEKGYSSEEANLILKSKSGDIEDKFNLAYFYYKGKDMENGMSMLKEISEKNRDKYGAISNNIIADKILSENNFEEASKLYLKTASYYKADSEIVSEALYKAGYCYFKLDKTKLAQTIIDKLKKDFPDSSWSAKAVELEGMILK